MSEVEVELKGDEPVDMQDDRQDMHSHTPYLLLNRNKAYKEKNKMDDKKAAHELVRVWHTVHALI